MYLLVLVLQFGFQLLKVILVSSHDQRIQRSLSRYNSRVRFTRFHTLRCKSFTLQHLLKFLNFRDKCLTVLLLKFKTQQKIEEVLLRANYSLPARMPDQNLIELSSAEGQSSSATSLHNVIQKAMHTIYLIERA